MPATTTRLALVAALAVGCLSQWPAPADAFVVHQTSDGTPLHWPRTARPVATLDPSFDALFTSGDAVQLVDAAASRWTASDCTQVEVQAAAGPACPGEDEDDDVNCVYAVTDPLLWDGSANQVALTLLHFDNRRGTIVDVDMAFNAAFFAFSTEAICDATTADLDAVVTHEFGHFFGLDHSDRPDATMAPTSGPGDCGKRDLAADDEAGLCFIYEHLSDEDGGGCHGAPMSPATPVGLAVCAMLCYAARRRTLRRAHP
ncbi:MAG: matrixin family metalloprotease [Myxococcota bacterium]